MLRLGGHFPGSAVLHWDKGCQGKGILCTGAALSLLPAHVMSSLLAPYLTSTQKILSHTGTLQDSCYIVYITCLLQFLHLRCAEGQEDYGGVQVTQYRPLQERGG